MAIGSADSAIGRPQPDIGLSAPTQPGKPESVTAEANETPAVTKQEAAKGDPLARRKLAKQAEAQTSNQVSSSLTIQAPDTQNIPTQTSGDAAATAEGKGQAVKVLA